MKYLIYALRDRTANNFRNITMDINDQVATRGLAYAVNNASDLEFIAKDIELCRIAEFDAESGVITPVNPIVTVVRADSLIGVKDD